MTLLEMSEYLSGEKIFKNVQHIYVPNGLSVSLAKYLTTSIPKLNVIVKFYDDSDMFYQHNTLIDNFFNNMIFIPSDEVFKLKDFNKVYTNCNTDLDLLKREVFYNIKIKSAVKQISSELLFYANRFNDINNIPLCYFPKLLPEMLFKQLCSGFYKEPVQIIANALQKPFKPITHLSYKVISPNKDSYEVYIESQDRVAILPKDAAKNLTQSDLQNIIFKNGLLYIYDKPLHEICGKYGIYKEGAYNLNACD